MKKISFILLFISSYSFALDTARFFDELNFLKDSVVKVEDKKEAPKEVQVKKSEIVNLENTYFSDEVSVKPAAPVRSR